MVAVYYNRKIAHMFAGGVPILASPIVLLTNLDFIRRDNRRHCINGNSLDKS